MGDTNRLREEYPHSLETRAPRHTRPTLRRHNRMTEGQEGSPISRLPYASDLLTLEMKRAVNRSSMFTLSSVPRMKISYWLVWRGCQLAHFEAGVASLLVRNEAGQRLVDLWVKEVKTDGPLRWSCTSVPDYCQLCLLQVLDRL